MSSRRFRVPLLALGITAAFEVVYAAADSGAALTLWFVTDAPPLVQRLHAWRPLALGVRLTNRLGYRFDYASFGAPWQFDAIARSAGFLITFAMVLLALRLWFSLRERINRKALESAPGAT